MIGFVAVSKHFFRMYRSLLRHACPSFDWHLESWLAPKVCICMMSSILRKSLWSHELKACGIIPRDCQAYLTAGLIVFIARPRLKFYRSLPLFADRSLQDLLIDRRKPYITFLTVPILATSQAFELATAKGPIAFRANLYMQIRCKVRIPLKIRRPSRADTSDIKPQ